MSHIILGAYAHVDGGKTTLSEAILHRCGALRKSGRVDHEDSFLDYDRYERKKGITVYTKEARFTYKNREYIYVDTPGHLDFAGEVNRSFRILDLAIVIIDASSSLPADTIRRFHYLQTLHIPIIVFLNKMDITHRPLSEILPELQKSLDPAVVPLAEMPEACALNHEELLDRYLAEGSVEDRYIKEDLREGRIVPLLAGSALHEDGIDELLDLIDRYIDAPAVSSAFKAYIYKVDQYAHLKVFSGTLKNRDSFGAFKISEIVRMNGSRIEAVQEAEGGDLCAVKGLQGLKAGTYLPSLFTEEDIRLNTLTYRIGSQLDDSELYRRIVELNDEFPELKITLSRGLTIDLAGDLQKDFIRELIQERYGIEIHFSEPLIQYRESIEEPVYGVGHYEPLRHYAEVLVELRPSAVYRIKAGKEYGVLTDYLLHYRPNGLLCNMPLDQIEIAILEVRTHIKHTEGGDLVQALNRAIRQALYKGRSYLLEPCYLVCFRADPGIISGIIAELSALQHVFDIEDDSILAKIPKHDYNDLILSLRNRFKDGFSYEIEGEIMDRCRNEKEVIQRIGYDFRDDPSQPIGSIFTRNGAGTYVPPEEVEANRALASLSSASRTASFTA